MMFFFTVTCLSTVVLSTGLSRQPFRAASVSQRHVVWCGVVALAQNIVVSSPVLYPDQPPLPSERQRDVRVCWDNALNGLIP